jgi:hypothetical protein
MLERLLLASTVTVLLYLSLQVGKSPMTSHENRQTFNLPASKIGLINKIKLNTFQMLNNVLAGQESDK